jgi:Staphylococcus phage HNH endonuclease
MNDATPERRCCEVCGGWIPRGNTFGICTRTPECRTARNRKKRRSQPRPEPRTCKVCGRSIRRDNELGICQRRDSPECQNARARWYRENGSLGKARYCEICGRQLRRDNSMGVCYGRDSDACAKERDWRRRHGRAVSEGWTRPPYIEAGAVFARLTVLEDVKRSENPVLCRCECGTVKRIGRAVYLAIGATRSCGCLRRDLLTRHGFSKHPLYKTWNGIVGRTTNPNDHAWENYGGLGITMCQKWLDDPWAFAEDIARECGPRPEIVTEGGWPEYTIDRIDNSGNYEPGNVRWAPWSVQSKNKRKIPELTKQRNALTAQVQALTAQIQTLEAQAPRKRRPESPAMDPLF